MGRSKTKTVDFNYVANPELKQISAAQLEGLAKELFKLNMRAGSLQKRREISNQLIPIV